MLPESWFIGPLFCATFYDMHKYYVTYKYGQKLAQNTKETNGSTSNPWFNYSHAHSGVVMFFFCPHVHSICMRCINWPSMKWTTLHASNYHMGWILVQNCVRPCTRVWVQGNECVRGMPSCTSSLRACTASMAQGGRVHYSGTSSTSLWSIHARRSRQRLHMCHVASWTVRETLCSVPLVF